MNEVATIIYSLPESNYKNIVDGGYLLRYSQRCAFYHVNNANNGSKTIENHKGRVQIIPINDMEIPQIYDGALVDETIVQKIIDKDMKSSDINLYIASRMFMNTIKYGSISAYARSCGITYPTLHKYVNQYKERIKKCYRKESQL